MSKVMKFLTKKSMIMMGILISIITVIISTIMVFTHTNIAGIILNIIIVIVSVVVIYILSGIYKYYDEVMIEMDKEKSLKN